MKLDIAILSRGPHLYSTQSLMRAGLRRGHRMRIIDYARCSLMVGRGNNRIFYENERLPNFPAIIPRIGASFTSEGAAVISHFESLNTFSTVKAKALLQSRNKLRALQKLSRCGLEVPRTVYLGGGQDLSTLVDFLGGFPIVIKLQESTHGVGVLLADNLRSAEATIEALQKLRGKIILQEFIREAESRDIRAIVIAGEVAAVMERQAKDGEFRANLHRGASASKILLSEEEEKLVINAVKVIGLDVAGVDLLRSSRGPLLMEVNASPGLEGIEAVTRVDVAGQIISFTERRVRELFNYQRNLKRWHSKETP